MSQLKVYLNKIFVGILEQKTHEGGALSFSYDTEYLTTTSSLPLSISLPLRAETFGEKELQPFFTGLLPEEQQLKLLSKQLKVSPQNPFAILSKIGRDCAGAMEVLLPKEKPIAYGKNLNQPLNEEDIYKAINDVYMHPLLASEKKGNRISLAGAQSKLAVYFDEKPDALPQFTKGNPTTHILKPEIPNFPNSVHNEYFCMKLAKLMNLDVAEVFLKFAKEKPYLLIRRYDREQNSAGFTVRLHQEDFCQALGLMPKNKYQGVDGGPGIKTCLDLIQKYSSQPAGNIFRFINAVIFNYLIGNSDAHGKNFSFLYDQNHLLLAPFYDLLSTAIYEEKFNHLSEMAMKIGKNFEPMKVTLADWHSLFPQNQSTKTTVNKILKNYALTTPIKAQFLKESLEKQGITSPVFDEIINLITKRSNKILGYFKS